MIRFLARFIGLWMIAGALVALVIDGAKTIAASALTVTPLGLALASFGPETLASFRRFIVEDVEASIGHWLWDPVIQWIMLAPTWAMLGILGGLLAWFGRKRRLSAAYA